MRKLLCLILMMAVVFSLYPSFAREGAVDDLAGVLHPDFIREVGSLDDQFRQSFQVGIKVITRDFLGGKQVQAYADQTREALGDDSLILLVLVIGEEQYAASLGQAASQQISADRVESLLNDHFRGAFLKDRAYDRALAAFLLGASGVLQEKTGQQIKLSSLLRGFAGEQVPEVPALTQAPDSGIDSLDSIFEDTRRNEDDARQYDEDARDAAQGQGKGLSLFQIALIGFILYKIFGKKRSGKNGCSPLGWIFGAWGFSKFFGWRK